MNTSDANDESEWVNIAVRFEGLAEASVFGSTNDYLDNKLG